MKRINLYLLRYRIFFLVILYSSILYHFSVSVCLSYQADAHQHIAYKGYEVAFSSLDPAQLEFTDYIGQIWQGSDEEDRWGSIPIPDDRQSDEWSYWNHFWKPSVDYYRGLNTDDIYCPPLVCLNRQYASAPERAQYIWISQVIPLYLSGNKIEAYRWLGHVAHLLADMSVPAHVNLDGHYEIEDSIEVNPFEVLVNWVFVGDDSYETYISSRSEGGDLSNYSLWNSNGLIPIYAEDIALSQFYESLPIQLGWANHQSDLFRLFFNLANQTEGFSSDDKSGTRSEFTTMNGPSAQLQERIGGNSVNVFHIPDAGTIIPIVDFGVIKSRDNYDRIVISDEIFGSIPENNLIRIDYGYVPKFFLQKNDFDRRDISDYNCRIIGNTSMPSSIKHTAGLYKLFWKTVNPINLRLTGVTSDSISLSWDEPGIGHSFIGRYRIFFGDTSGFYNSYIDTPTADNNYTISGLDNSKNYYITVVPIYQSGNFGAKTNEIIGTTNTSFNPRFSYGGITPSSPNSSDSVFSSIQYFDPDNDPVDVGSVKVIINETQQIIMNSSSNLSGAIFRSSENFFPKGAHRYRFVGSQNGVSFPYPIDGSTIEFTVTDNTPIGLSVTATPPSLTICGSESSLISATLTDNYGLPVPNQEIAFVILEGERDGYLYPESDYTRSTEPDKGKAFSTFTPSTARTFKIGAVRYGLPVAQTNVVVSNCSADINANLNFNECTTTTSRYEIQARVTSHSNPQEPIQNQSARVKVQKLDGTLFGSLDDGSGNSGNPVNTETDHHGDIDVNLYVTQTSDIKITIECSGSTKVIQSQVFGGCVPPTNIPAFTNIPASVSDWPSDPVSFSPDGKRIAVVEGRNIQIYDVETWKTAGSWTPWLTLQHPAGSSGRPARAVAWSPNGSYIAIGYEDPNSTRPALVVWNAGPSTSDFSIRFSAMKSSTSYTDVYSLAWSPDSNFIMTGERLITLSSIGGKARIWNMSGSNTWTSPIGPDDVHAVAWASSNYKAVAFNSDKVWIFNPSNTRTVITTWSGEPAYSVSWNGAGTHLAVGVHNSGAHAPIQVYNTNGVLQYTFAEHSEVVSGLHWHPTTNKLVSSGFNQDIRTWQGSGGGPSQIFGSGAFVDVMWSPSGQEILATTLTNIYVYAPGDSVGPTITISAPQNNYQTNSSTVTVEGTIVDSHIVSATISVNGSAPVVLPLGASNTFSYVVDLVEGANSILISAQDGAGNSNTRTLSVTRVVPHPDFSLAISPATLSLAPSESGVYTLELISQEGFNEGVTLSASNLPSGVTAQFSANPAVPTTTVQVTLTASTAALSGLYTITISGQGGGKNHQTTADLVINLPEINIRQSGTSIADGSGSYNFGSANVGVTRIVSFTVENLGGATLTLLGAPAVAIGGDNASEFVVTQHPASSIGSGNSTNFTISFTPAGMGVRTASVSIENNDSDENPYSFQIIGTGTQEVIIPLIAPISDHAINQGTSYTGPTPTLTMGTTPITWSLVSGPSGMTINSSNGVVSWPNPITGGSPFTVTIRATNSAGVDVESWLLTVNIDPMLDTDNDGMPDAWEIEHNLNRLVDDALTDSDNDGFSNLREYLSGSDPRNENDRPPILADFEDDNDVDGKDLSFFLQEFGRTDCDSSPDPCDFDLDTDGDVDVIDMRLFIEDFGRSQN